MTAFVAPNILAPLDKAWAKFGLLLHRIMNPLIMRMLGKDPLRRRMGPDVKYYWIERTLPGPESTRLGQQF